MVTNLKGEEIILSTVSLLAIIGGAVFRNEVISLVAVVLLLLCCIFILGRHLPEIANISSDNPKVKTMRLINWFAIGIILLGLAATFLSNKDWITTNQEKYLSIVLIVMIMVVIGNLAPKIPFNRYLGLRLPWTVRDEETWIVAHRILGYIAFPLVICFLVMLQFFELSTCVTVTIISWIIIPGLISGVFFWKKNRGLKV